MLPSNLPLPAPRTFIRFPTARASNAFKSHPDALSQVEPAVFRGYRHRRSHTGHKIDAGLQHP
ncbi:hypothetical protein BV20DRAFT_70049 [Pilatotrama ljubarskyi]|nr:hypothetical protein BV20DRAFT_70049 [Pilatotrama ljubarskyi]